MTTRRQKLRLNRLRQNTPILMLPRKPKKNWLISNSFRIIMQNSIASTSLRISEIFYSLQGESTRVGLPSVFIRLTGCPLRCTYCDTTYAFSGGANQTLQEIIQTVATYKTRYICVTGGEPL